MRCSCFLSGDKVSKTNSVKIVKDFWAAVWQVPQDVDAIDRFVVDDFVITTGVIKSWSRAIL
jgi:hypothetical protein